MEEVFNKNNVSNVNYGTEASTSLGAKNFLIIY